MLRLCTVLFLCAALIGCRNESSGIKAIIGATLKNGSTSITDSVIVIDGSLVRAAGPRPAVPIPQNSERIDAAGKTIVPETGSLEPGQPASFQLLGSDGKTERVMNKGRWQSALPR